MGLLDSLRELLGTRAESDATRGADSDDLWGMSTAYITMAADLDYDAAGAAALCFAHVDSTDFDDAVAEVRDILEAGEVETGTTADLRRDEHGYDWVVLEDDDPEDLVTSIHFAADTFIERDYGSRLLAAVFAYEKADQRAYWIYSFRRGAYYPFAPDDVGNRERNETAEFKLESVLSGELEVEQEKEYWYPLWPSADGDFPWE